MKREDKDKIINSIAESIKEYPHFYLTDISDLNAEKTSNLRRECFKRDIKLFVVKNTLLQKAFAKLEGDYDELESVLKGHTSIMFTHTGNSPAKLIKEFRKKSNRPAVKAAFVEESVYIGDDQLESLIAVKSKDELLGDLILLLQSPMKKVVSQLQSGSNIITGVLKTLADKE